MMTSIADVVPTVVAQITGEPIPVDVHVAFLRRHARVARQQSAFQIATTMDVIAERLERAVNAGQLLPVRETA